MMKSFKVLSLGLVLISSASVMAAESSPGQKAFGAMSAVAPALRESVPNIRSACTSFGMFKAFESMANSTNTDRWTLRNLGFGEDEVKVLEDFCSSPKSRVTREEAIKAGESFSSNVGLE
jgi:hypothetical protein